MSELKRYLQILIPSGNKVGIRNKIFTFWNKKKSSNVSRHRRLVPIICLNFSFIHSLFFQIGWKFWKRLNLKCRQWCFSSFSEMNFRLIRQPLLSLFCPGLKRTILRVHHWEIERREKKHSTQRVLNPRPLKFGLLSCVVSAGLQPLVWNEIVEIKILPSWGLNMAFFAFKANLSNGFQTQNLQMQDKTLSHHGEGPLLPFAA